MLAIRPGFLQNDLTIHRSFCDSRSDQPLSQHRRIKMPNASPSNWDDFLRKFCHCYQGTFDCRDLVQRHLSGEREAGNALVLKFQQCIHAKITKAIRWDQRQDAEECVQEFWAKMFGQTADGRWRLQDWLLKDPPSRFCAWLRLCAKRHVIDWNLKKITELTGIDIEGTIGGRNDHDEPEPGPLAAVYECLSQVSPEYQKLFRLRIEEQLEWANIARELGVCEKTAFNRWNNLLGLQQKYLKLKGFDL